MWAWCAEVSVYGIVFRLVVRLGVLRGGEVLLGFVFLLMRGYGYGYRQEVENRIDVIIGNRVSVRVGSWEQ
jgi:hypothetical protein